MTLTPYKNESAVVGSIIFFVILLACFGFIYVIISPMVDTMIHVQNAGNFVTTQAHTDSINTLALIWKNLPIGVVFIAVVALIVESIRNQNGSV